jgi:hypothetical protein
MTRRRIDWTPVDHLLGRIRDGWIVSILAARGVEVAEAVVAQHRLRRGIARRRSTGLAATEELAWLAEHDREMAKAVRQSSNERRQLKQPGTPAEG